MPILRSFTLTLMSIELRVDSSGCCVTERRQGGADPGLMGRVLTVSYGASTCASDGTRNIDARNGLVWPQSVLFAIRHVTPVNLAPVTPLPASPASVIPTPCLARATGDAISMRNVALASPSAALVALVGVQMRRYPIRPAIPGVQPADARQARISRQDMDHPIALRSCGHGWN